MTKRIFLAGASGAIGRRLAPLLVANGWQVFGSTRSKDKEITLRSMGVEPVLVDVFDGAALSRLVSEIHPEVVIHQLTDLPYALAASEMTAALVRNARLRDELLDGEIFYSLREAHIVIESWRGQYNRASQHPSVYVVEENRSS